jgi:hydrogenase maturation protease
MKNKIALIGLGNILLRDEGVGVHVVNAIKKRYTFSPPVELIDGGTVGLDLLPFFEDYEKILIVDAVDFGKEPGHIESIEDDHIPSVLLPKLSVHHIGLCDVLFAAKLTDLTPEKICLIGVQPESIDVGLEMTEQITSTLGAIMDLIIKKLKQWDVTCALPSL